MKMTELESDILDYIYASYPSELKGNAAGDLKVSEREYTGAGVIVSFKPASKVNHCEFNHLIGPLIVAPELELGAETTLSIYDGYVDYLEIMVRGNGTIQNVTTYQFIDEDVNFIDDTDT